MNLPIYFLDVFAETPFSGNQLAVLFDSGGLTTEQMQRIAKETNFSETTFLTSREIRDGGYDVRIFTPDTELPFAGHPTLGTAYAIRRFLLGGAEGGVRLNLGIGQIPVHFAGGDALWMRQAEPEFGELLDRALIARVLAIEESDLDEAFAPRWVSNGMPTIVVPVRTGEALARVDVAKGPYQELMEKTGNALISTYSKGGYEAHQQLSVRVFGHCFGVAEDPATGSAAGCLAAYLAHERYFADPEIEVIVGQGYGLKRPSTLYLKACDEGGSVKIDVGGKVQFVGEGMFSEPRMDANTR